MPQWQFGQSNRLVVPSDGHEGRRMLSNRLEVPLVMIVREGVEQCRRAAKGPDRLVGATERFEGRALEAERRGLLNLKGFRDRYESIDRTLLEATHRGQGFGRVTLPEGVPSLSKGQQRLATQELVR